MKLRTKAFSRLLQNKTGHSSPVSAPEPSEQEVPNVATPSIGEPLTVFIDDDTPVEDEDFTAVVSTLFDADKFQKLWEDKAATLFVKIQDSIATTYAFNDVVSSLEELLIDHNIDRGAELVDAKLTSEIEGLVTFKLLLLLAEHLFDGDDYKAVREFMLQPEEATRIRKTGKSDISLSIKEMYEAALAKVGRAPSKAPGLVSPGRKQ